MTEGVDYAWARPSIGQLVAAGKRLACRYVSYDSSGKNLTLAEATALSAAGIAIVTNWEWYGTDQLGGYDLGVQHAREADRQHRACGGPPGRPIYFSTDFDASASQLAGPIAQYLRGAASVLGLARVGVYGGLRTVRYALDQGLVRWAWQTYAWSGGAWDARANIQQYRNGVTLAGATLDLDRATTADYGQWTVGGDDMALTDPVLRAYFESYDGKSVNPNAWLPLVLEKRLGVGIDALRVELAAAEAREVARDAAQTELLRGIAAAEGVTLTDAQVAALAERAATAVTAAVAETRDRVLAELARQETEREAAMRAALAAETA